MTDPCGAGEELELRIDGLAAGGDGVGRDAGGRVVFVPLVAPGDRARVRLVERKERYARATLVRLIEAGPGRVEAPCEVFGRCGGCAWQHLSYPIQCRAKEQIVRDALERIAKVQVPAFRWYASPRAYGYRARTRVAVSRGNVGYRRGRSHEVVATDRCPILLPALEEALGTLAAAPPDDGEWELAVDAQGRASVAPLAGPPTPRQVHVAEDKLTVSTGVFTQANPFLIGPWSRYICRAVGSGSRVLELFAGIGTLSLPLARQAAELVAVEGDANACAHLRDNLARACLPAAVLEAHVGDATLRDWIDRYRPEVVVLDPPRGGLGRDASRTLGATRVRRVVYAACDPAPWARDLRVLCEAGFALEHTAGFDFFPQSPHVETVAVLSRR